MSDTDQFDDRNIIARVAWGEARGLGQDGMQATINTGQNRVASGVTWWGTTLREVFLKPWQYSCLNPGDPNRSKLLSVDETDPQFVIALGLADQALVGNLPDIVNLADSYFDNRLTKPPGWSQGLSPVATIGTQCYYRTV